MSMRLIASGVHRTCEALATKRRWLLNERSNRSSMASNISARSLISSLGSTSATSLLSLPLILTVVVVLLGQAVRVWPWRRGTLADRSGEHRSRS
jgi:hypothetical protein